MLYIYLMWHQHQHQQRQHHSMCTCILRLRLRNTLTCLISLPSFIFFAYFFIPFSVALSLSLVFFFQTSPAHFFYMFNGCPFRIHTAHVLTVKKKFVQWDNRMSNERSEKKIFQKTLSLSFSSIAMTSPPEYYKICFILMPSTYVAPQINRHRKKNRIFNDFRNSNKLHSLILIFSHSLYIYI